MNAINPLVMSIVGLTATGKTSAALAVAELSLAKKLFSSVHLISADSRQVYKGLEIVSGADVPNDFTLVHRGFPFPHYQKGPILWHGVSCLEPDQPWSLAHFQTFAQQIIRQIQESASQAPNKKTLIIIVGGTGLYHRHLFNPEIKKQPGPNQQLRSQLSHFSLESLQARLRAADEHLWSKLTVSDQKNPRRLIRAIEKLDQPAPNQESTLPESALDESFLGLPKCTIGLKASLDELEKRIRIRVTERFNQGAVAEVESLLKKYADPNLPIFSATGVKELTEYLEDQSSESKCLNAWCRREVQYARRQMTWWKKTTGVEWFSVDQPDWLEKMQQFVTDILN